MPSPSVNSSYKKVLVRTCLAASLTALSAGLTLVQAEPAVPTEAPAGFNTPSFNSAHSINNGLIEPPGDSFALDQQIYEQDKTVALGLGPVYNATSCVACHQNPNSGAAGQITELRVGHNDANGNFVNPTIYINDGQNTITGRSIVNDRAIGPQAQEVIPKTENIRALRATLNTLGDGFVEAIDDNTLIAIAAAQPKLSDGRVHGEVVEAPIFEAPGQTRVGRFGWKDQHSSLLSFIADAYLNEMGITFTIPAALGNKIIHPFSDFLLHDIGTGDGIVQVGPQDTANKLRTAPLWGLRDKARFMHDLASLSLDNAIDRHEGEAHEPARHFRELSHDDKEALITFLRSL
jgi:CxxC motif-containing protein (DUF1111 family)